MRYLKYSQCPCCEKENPIPFMRKINMGLWSTEKCFHCKCEVRENRIIGSIITFFVMALLPIGIILVIELFQLMFGTAFGLSMGYFIVGAFLGITISFYVGLWLCYLFIPLVPMTNNGNKDVK